jgi:hypothetical protein
MKKSVSLAIASIALLLLFPLRALNAQGPPALPNAFFGAVTLDGQPAPVGAQVEARGEGVLTATDDEGPEIAGNPLEVSTAGRYGGAEIYDEKLIVQGTLSAGAAISFYVNGLLAECAAPGGAWQSSWPFEPGGVTELNLRAFSTEQPTAAPSPTATTPLAATATPQPTVTPSPTGTAISATATATAQPTATLQSTATLQPTATPPTTPLAAQSTVLAVASTPIATGYPEPTVAQPLTTLPAPPTPEPTPLLPAEATVAAPDPASTAPPTDAPSTLASAQEQRAVATPTISVDTTIAALIQASTPTPAQETTGRSGLWFVLAFVGIAVVAAAVILVGGKRLPKDADDGAGA